MTGRMTGNALSLCLRMQDLRDEIEMTETSELRKCEDELRDLEVMIGGVLQDICGADESENAIEKWKTMVGCAIDIAIEEDLKRR